MTAWTQLGIACCASQADIVADLLDEADALSVTIEGMGEQVLFQLKPEETPLWQTINITALFSQQTDVKKRIVLKNKHYLEYKYAFVSKAFRMVLGKQNCGKNSRIRFGTDCPDLCDFADNSRKPSKRE